MKKNISASNSLNQDDFHYLLINDTRSELHWGCQGVSESILHILQLRGIVHATITTAELKALEEKKILSRVNKLILDFPSLIVIVNGEGSLHPNNTEGKKIIRLLESIDTEFEIWNSSIYEIPVAWENVLKRARKIVLRDTMSLDLFDNNYNTYKCPDLLFYFLKCRKVSPECISHFVFTDSVVDTHKKVRYSLGLDEKWQAFDIRFGPKSLLININNLPILKIFRYAFNDLLRVFYRGIFRGDIYRFDGRRLPVGSTILTGRYHYLVMCLFMGKGVILLETNTPKISALIKMLQIDNSGFQISESFSIYGKKISVESLDMDIFKEYFEELFLRAYG